MELTANRLRELLNYDPITGLFTNKAARKKVQIGDPAGGIDKSTGYIVIGLDRKSYYGHRLACLYMTGEWPPELMDHRDGVKTNNAWANLRPATRQTNQENQRQATKRNKAGLLGAYQKRGKWQSAVQVAGRTIRLGVFDTALQAHEAYVKAKRQLHIGCTI